MTRKYLLALVLWSCSWIPIAHAQGGPCSAELIGSVPPHGYVDARSDGRLQGISQGIDRVTLFFNSNAIGECFSVSSEGGDLNLEIAGIVQSGNQVDITFTRPIKQSDGWVSIKYDGSSENSHVDIAQLWGDVDGSLCVNGADLIHHVDCMNNAVSCELTRVDLDRSGMVGPSDIISRVDAINHNYSACIGPRPHPGKEPKLKVRCRASAAPFKKAISELLKTRLRDAGGEGVAVKVTLKKGASQAKTVLASEFISPALITVDPIGSATPVVAGDPSATTHACSQPYTYEISAAAKVGGQVVNGTASGSINIPGILQ